MARLSRENGVPSFSLSKKILANLGTNLFQDKADMRRKRIVAQHRVPGLEEVDGADCGQRCE